MRLSPSRLVRLLLRVLTLAALLLVLLGAPVAVVALLGRPLPSADQWSAMWHARSIDIDAAVRLGGGLFIVLWVWFAVTAVHELVRVWPVRHVAVDRSARRVRVSDGPSAWIRGAVRFIALSSVSVGAVAGGLSTVTHAAEPSSAHVVVAGESYWAIAEDHLDLALGRRATPNEVWALTKDLVAANAPRLGHRDPTLLLPGETVVVASEVDVPNGAVVPAPAPAPVPAPAPAPAAAPTAPALPVASASTVTTGGPSAMLPTQPPTRPASEPVVEPTLVTPLTPAALLIDEHDSGVGAGAVLSGALLLAAGALTAVQVRRRRTLRGSTIGVRLEEPSFRTARLELLLRALDPVERMARLDVAVRAAARDLAAQESAVLAVTMDDAGEICLLLAAPAVPNDSMWHADIVRGVWRLPASVPIDELAAAGRDVTHPCPGLVQIGTLHDGAALFVDLEAMGVLSVDSRSAAAIGRAVTLALAWSPWRGGGSVVVERGMTPARDELDVCADAAAVWTRVTDVQRAVTSSLRGPTFAARAVASGGENWELVSAVVRGPRPADVDAVSPWAGVGVLLLGPASTPFCIRADGADHVLEPFGLQFSPTVLEDELLGAIEAIVDDAAAPPSVAIPASVPLPLPVPSAAPIEWHEPKWDLLVTVLGQVSVQDRAGRLADFEKAKSLELIVWLTHHRERPTRRAARNALWDLAVRDSTFANVVSDARRSLARLVAPPHGEEWIARTLTDDLPLHTRVVTDAELLAGRMAAARDLPPAEAVALLRPGVELLHGLPFSGAGNGYLWVDGEGHTSSLVLLATGAAELLARHHLALGDIDGVFWATGQGLKVLAGHEALIGLRMQAHASRGDLAGVRFEWEQYERSLAADTWSDGEPSPKLAALRRELLAPAEAASSAAGR